MCEAPVEAGQFPLDGSQTARRKGAITVAAKPKRP
ncbi:hypothetical protein N182_34870 [Sinorhizobium sp. GL2]|nr:hypothetical protein N182_34870 [Sinorhizobium sp. GL2]